jgi:hypothetical protein
VKLYRPLLLVAALCSGCLSTGEDLTLRVNTELVHGPKVTFDPLERPIPNIPLPNDLALTPSDSTASGVAWNTSIERVSEHQVHLRNMLNKLDGFGPFAPVMVGFDGPLDLTTVTESTIVLINIEPGHPREGEMAPLDLGQGYFPVHGDPHAYYGHDPFQETTTLTLAPDNFAVVEEGGEPEFVGHYDTSTNDLIIRPIVPLAQGAQHAVLITRSVFGQAADGTIGPVRSPFEHKAHLAQLPLIAHAAQQAGIDEADLAFGWTYTTSDIVEPLMALREGLYGRGRFQRLASVVEPKITEIRDTSILHDADGVSFPEDPRDNRFILQGEFFSTIVAFLGQIQDDDNFNIQFKNVDYLVFGSWHTPNIRNTPRRELSIDTFTGEGEVTVEDVPFMIAVPKTTERYRPPFPVMFYFHGTGTSRFEPLAVADTMARLGIAVIAFDQVGHGPLIQDIPRLLEENPDVAELLPTLLPVLVNLLAPERLSEFFELEAEEALEKFKEVGLFSELAVHGRAEDINEDGRMDVAESFFYADPFRLCASFWQDLVDMMQMVKIVRNLSQDNVPSEPLENPGEATYEQLAPYLLSGDFNADGILDVGGPNVPFSLAGTSLGGMHAVMGAAIEPEITTVSPVVAGAGILDIMLRSGLHFILEPLFAEVFGNLVVGCEKEGVTYFTQGNSARRCRNPKIGKFGQIDTPAEGTVVTLRNQENGESAETMVNADGGFALAVESDKGDRLELTIGEGASATRFETECHEDGAGYARNSSTFRRATALQQHAFDRCDPANFAPHLIRDPLYSSGPKNVLLLNAIGDDTVPTSTNVLLGLITGVLGQTRSEWEPTMEALIDAKVLENAHYDVHDVRGDNPEDEPAIGLFEPVETSAGVSTLRLADVNGKHEWIAGYEKDGFEFGRYSQNQLAIYHACGGKAVADQPADCLASEDCALLDDLTLIEGCEPISGY